MNVKWKRPNRKRPKKKSIKRKGGKFTKEIDQVHRMVYDERADGSLDIRQTDAQRRYLYRNDITCPNTACVCRGCTQKGFLGYCIFSGNGSTYTQPDRYNARMTDGVCVRAHIARSTENDVRCTLDERERERERSSPEHVLLLS